MVNAICIVWATMLDTWCSTALAPALGATPSPDQYGDLGGAVLPTLASALLGVAAGIGVAELLDEDPVAVPPRWQLLTVVLGCVAAINPFPW